MNTFTKNQTGRETIDRPTYSWADGWSVVQEEEIIRQLFQLAEYKPKTAYALYCRMRRIGAGTLRVPTVNDLP
jgi:hypothetical protein